MISLQRIAPFAAKLSQASLIALVTGFLVLSLLQWLAPSYAAVTILAVPPVFLAAYFAVVPWIWRRFPALKSLLG